MSILRLIRRDKLKFLFGTVVSLIAVHLLFLSYSDDRVVELGKSNGRVSDPLKSPSNPEHIPAQSPENPSTSFGSGSSKTEKVDQDIIKSIRDYTVFFNGLEDYAIKSPSIKKKYINEKDGQAKELSSGDDSFLFSKDYLESRLDISDTLFKELKDSHTRYVDERINKLVENYGLSTFGNILMSDPEWSNYQGSSGYVMIGGGEYSWLSYLVIKQIRKTGAKLPIELFIATEEEYEKDFCEKLLPTLNARCNLFDGKFAKELNDRFKIGGYQYKMLAIMTSKFENVLYIDSDNFPTTDVDYLFESKKYTETQFIIWPDNWARTTNPKYYEIAGVPVHEKKISYNNYDYKQAKEAGSAEPRPLNDYTFKQTWYHTFEGTLPDPTSETGMLMINKTSHLKTLLLCLYYNVFGPNYYYPLFTQGSAGEGDKETFIGAAHVMKEKWFQTLKQFRWVGYFKETDGSFTSKALGHYDPDQSAVLHEKEGKEEQEDIDLIFMHLSYPKYYPNWLADNHELVYEGSGSHIRMYDSIYSNIGYDFDLRVMQIFTQALCPNYYDESGEAIDGSGVNKSEYMFKYLDNVRRDDAKNTKRCTEIFIPHLKWLKETTKYGDRTKSNGSS